MITDWSLVRAEVFEAERRGEWPPLHPVYAAEKEITHLGNIARFSLTEMVCGIDSGYIEAGYGENYPDADNKGSDKMNEFEQALIDKFLEGLHHLEKSVTKDLAEIRGDIKEMVAKNESEHKALRDMMERNIETDTVRLNDHAKQIDDLNERMAKQEEWKEQFQKQVANRIAVSQSVTAIAAVVIAFLLSKFL